MKFFIVICIIQMAFGAPNEPTVADQIQQQLAAFQTQAGEAVQTLSKKILDSAGAKTNQELLTRFDSTASDYATQLKETTNKLAESTAPQRNELKQQIDTFSKTLAENAASLLGGGDATKATQLKQTYENVLTQAKTLQSRFSEHGEELQGSLAGLFENLLKTTKESAQKVAAQLDEATAKP